MIYPKALILFFFSFFLTSMVCAQIKQDSLLDLANPDPELQFQDNFYEALKHKGIENYTIAIDALINCAELYPERAVIYFQLGDLYYKTKAFSRAESNLQKAILLDENNFWYKEKLYQLYVHKEDYNKAITAVKPLLFKHQAYQEELVDLNVSAGHYETALEQIEKLDAQYGYTSERDQTRVNIYLQTDNQNDHVQFLKNRLSETPENDQHFLNLIYTLSQYGLKDEAFATSESFFKFHPQSHIVHVALYKFYLDDKAYDKAINSMKIVTSSNVLPPHIKVKVLSDFLQFVKEKPAYKSVLTEVEPAASLDVSNRSNLEWASYYYKEKNLPKALGFYEKELLKTPENLVLIQTIANLYLETMQYERAVEFTLAQMEFFPTQIPLYLAYGRAQFHLQQWDAALEWLEIGMDYIFEENETVKAYYILMSDLYTKNNNIAKAKTFANKAKAINKE
jgi:tetratricopeptide (TPR) repeat protein